MARAAFLAKTIIPEFVYISWFIWKMVRVDTFFYMTTVANMVIWNIWYQVHFHWQQQMSRVVWSISKSVVECFPQFHLGVTNSIESHFPKNTFGLIRRGIINYLIMNAAHFFLRNLRWIKIHFGIDNKFKWSDKMLFYRVTTVKYPGISWWQQWLYCINNCTWTVFMFCRLNRFQ